MPHGVNIYVAIMCGKQNQEDSILINKSSIERGLLHTEHYKTYIQKEERQSFNDEEKFCIPNPKNTIGIKSANYSKLDQTGFIKVGSYVEANDIIIGKCIPIKKETSQYVNKDASIVLKNNEEGIITNVYKGQNSDGYTFVKIQVRDERSPMVGDKLSSRHGQKGIIGQVIDNADMPTTKDGITPDIIINVHCIPSRMTVAHLHETNFSVLCSLLGYFGDATPFSNYNPENIYELLENLGMNRHSNQHLYNGITGDFLEAEIFMGTTYYQRLKHMVCEKEHSRDTGPILNLTRQPAEGRNRDGGFRVGEMEVNCMQAHGISYMCKERLLDVSDLFITHVCNKCGQFATVNENANIYNCIYCNNKYDFSIVQIPFPLKLLFQELQAMSIIPRMICE